MNVSMQARSLWSLWLKEHNISPQAQSFPFYARVEALLARNELSPVLNALFAMVDELESAATLNDLVAQVQRMAQWVHVEDKGSFHSVLVAMPVSGSAALQGSPETLWAGVEKYLQHRFQQRLKARGQGPLGLDITPVPQLLSPESCVTLDLDGVHRWTQELASGQVGAITRGLLEWQAEHPLQGDTQLAVAVITHNARQLRAHETLDQWLTELDPNDWVWKRQMVTEHGHVQQPRPFIEAMADSLFEQIETGMEDRCQSLGTSMRHAAVAWTEMIEEDLSDTMHLSATVDGVVVPPLVLPCGWFSLTGPAVIGEVLSMWDYPLEVACENAEVSPDEETLTSSAVLSFRRR